MIGPRPRKLRLGRVVSDRMDKTVVVEVERMARHHRYGKVVRLRRKMKAHDERNECAVGDIVRIEETRPLSKEKRWRVVAIVQRRAQAAVRSEALQETPAGQAAPDEQEEPRTP